MTAKGRTDLMRPADSVTLLGQPLINRLLYGPRLGAFIILTEFLKSVEKVQRDGKIQLPGMATLWRS